MAQCVDTDQGAYVSVLHRAYASLQFANHEYVLKPLSIERSSR